MVEDQERKPFGPPARGAVVVTQATERKMKLYGLFETELDTLTFYDSGAGIFFAVGSLLLGSALDTFIGAGDKRDPANFKIAVICGLIAVLVYGVGAVLIYKRGTLLKKIKKESLPLGEA